MLVGNPKVSRKVFLEKRPKKEKGNRLFSIIEKARQTYKLHGCDTTERWPCNLLKVSWLSKGTPNLSLEQMDDWVQLECEVSTLARDSILSTRSYLF